MGHTMSIHSRNDEVILQFGLKKPAYRIVVNTPTTHGSIGLTTGLDPAMTLGCGGYGGNITSDNISPRHLLNIKRLAYEIDAGRVAQPADRRPRLPATLPKAPAAPPAPRGVGRGTAGRRIDEFLASRGYAAAGPPAPSASAPHQPVGVSAEAAVPGDRRRPSKNQPTSSARTTSGRRSEQGRKITIGERTIVTPAARDLASSTGCSSRPAGHHAGDAVPLTSLVVEPSWV